MYTTLILLFAAAISPERFVNVQDPPPLSKVCLALEDTFKVKRADFDKNNEKAIHNITAHVLRSNVGGDKDFVFSGGHFPDAEKLRSALLGNDLDGEFWSLVWAKDAKKISLEVDYDKKTFSGTAMFQNEQVKGEFSFKGEFKKEKIRISEIVLPKSKTKFADEKLTIGKERGQDGSVEKY